MRVVFFSNTDLSVGRNLEKAQIVLEKLKQAKARDINDLIELYNIKLYLDNNIYPTNWSKEELLNYKTILETAWSEIVQFFNGITDDQLLEEFDNLDVEYIKSFWQLVSLLSVYKRIKEQYFGTLIQQNPYVIRYILTHKNIVNHYSKLIVRFLKNHEASAELLLSNFEQDKHSKSLKYHFPKELKANDIEEIILTYLNQESPNLNYVRLIENSRSNELPLSDRTRLKAKRKSKELNDGILKSDSAIQFETQISIRKDQEIPIDISHKNFSLKISYSEKFLNKLESSSQLFSVFKNYFEFIDFSGLIDLVNRINQMDLLEKMMMKSKNEFLYGIFFQRKMQISQAQMGIYIHYLANRDKSIEGVLDGYLNDLKQKYNGLKELQFTFPSSDLSSLEKIRYLSPEFEFLLKQYQSYVTEKEIDIELLQLSSRPLNLGEIPSLNKKKYIYLNESSDSNLIHYFFSDQSSIHYVEQIQNSYSSFFDLIESEFIQLEMFNTYQQEIILYLIESGELEIKRDNSLQFSNPERIYVLKEIFEYETISYHHCHECIKTEINKMIDEGLLISSGTLFSKLEADYFNFHLNKKKFTNGFDLRNKYMHGTNGTSIVENDSDYILFIKMLVLVLLKIDDDLYLKYSLG